MRTLLLPNFLLRSFPSFSCLALLISGASLFGSVGVMADERNKQEKQQEKQQEHQEQQEPEQLDDLSDAQLTSLAADWSALDGAERSQLIQETRERMQPQARPRPAAQATPPTTPLTTAPGTHKVTIRPSGRTERRRYGRLVRQADGSVVRSVVEVETRVVTGQTGDRQRAFGMGFERRHNGATPRQTPNSLTTPVSVPAPLAQ